MPQQTETKTETFFRKLGKLIAGLNFFALCWLIILNVVPRTDWMTWGFWLIFLLIAVSGDSKK